jgi:hypothetical protein
MCVLFAVSWLVLLLCQQEHEDTSLTGKFIFEVTFFVFILETPETDYVKSVLSVVQWHLCLPIMMMLLSSLVFNSQRVRAIAAFSSANVLVMIEKLKVIVIFDIRQLEIPSEVLALKSSVIGSMKFHRTFSKDWQFFTVKLLFLCFDFCVLYVMHKKRFFSQARVVNGYELQNSPVNIFMVCKQSGSVTY